MISCFMDVQNSGHIQATRGSSPFFNATVEIHFAVFLEAFPSHSSVSLYKPATFELPYFFRMVPRCQMAEELSSALPDKLVDTLPSLALTGLERSSYDRFIKNDQPCLLALSHFLECSGIRVPYGCLGSRSPIECCVPWPTPS